MKLNEIADNKGARHRKMIIGRGIGSGKGKTGGRGYKGQKSRTGVSINGFEGGQMPLHRRLPKRGFKNYTRTEYQVFNLADLQRSVDTNLLDSKAAITKETLVQAGLIRNANALVKLLGNGELKVKLSITVDKASKTAVASVEKLGGTVTVTAAQESAAA
ncbi:MAG: 50S ribosomal protein L15 [Rickettsiales bacterium]|nr:50S ribosomal protein L15 [Rickettsiales bacterium]